VDNWNARQAATACDWTTARRIHRDGAHRFYCQVPEGKTLPLIYHPFFQYLRQLHKLLFQFKFNKNESAQRLLRPPIDLRFKINSLLS
jgi:hypothetical protein